MFGPVLGPRLPFPVAPIFSRLLLRLGSPFQGGSTRSSGKWDPTPRPEFSQARMWGFGPRLALHAFSPVHDLYKQKCPPLQVKLWFTGLVCILSYQSGSPSVLVLKLCRLHGQGPISWSTGGLESVSIHFDLQVLGFGAVAESNLCIKLGRFLQWNAPPDILCVFCNAERQQ